MAKESFGDAALSVASIVGRRFGSENEENPCESAEVAGKVNESISDLCASSAQSVSRCDEQVTSSGQNVTVKNLKRGPGRPRKSDAESALKLLTSVANGFDILGNDRGVQADNSLQKSRRRKQSSDSPSNFQPAATSSSCSSAVEVPSDRHHEAKKRRRMANHSLTSNYSSESSASKLKLNTSARPAKPSHCQGNNYYVNFGHFYRFCHTKDSIHIPTVTVNAESVELPEVSLNDQRKILAIDHAADLKLAAITSHQTIPKCYGRELGKLEWRATGQNVEVKERESLSAFNDMLIVCSNTAHENYSHTKTFRALLNERDINEMVRMFRNYLADKQRAEKIEAAAAIEKQYEASFSAAAAAWPTGSAMDTHFEILPGMRLSSDACKGFALATNSTDKTTIDEPASLFEILRKAGSQIWRACDVSQASLSTAASYEDIPDNAFRLDRNLSLLLRSHREIAAAAEELAGTLPPSTVKRISQAMAIIGFLVGVHCKMSASYFQRHRDAPTGTSIGDTVSHSLSQSQTDPSSVLKLRTLVHVDTLLHSALAASIIPLQNELYAAINSAYQFKHFLRNPMKRFENESLTMSSAALPAAQSGGGTGSAATVTLAEPLRSHPVTVRRRDRQRDGEGGTVTVTDSDQHHSPA